MIGGEFSSDLGCKITKWVHSDWGYSKPRFDCSRLLVIPDIPGKNHSKILPEVDRIPKGFEEDLRRKTKISKGKWCTTGFIALNWFLEINPVVHTVGWLQGDESSSQKFYQHYFAKKPNTQECHHDWFSEREYFNKLIKSKKVKIID